MKKERFETGKNPHLTITDCQGDFTIAGWEWSAVEISADDFTAAMPEFDHLTAQGNSDMTVMVPSGAVVVLEQISGAVTIKHLDGHLSLREGGGDITLGDTGSVIINTARGDVRGENVDGPLTILEANGKLVLDRVGELQVMRAWNGVSANFVRGSVDLGEVDGPLTLHTVSGDLSAASCGGDLLLSNLGGIIQLARVAGTVRLEGGLSSGQHTVTAAGDIIVRWPVDAPLSLTAGGNIVKCPLLLEARTETISESRTVITGHIDAGKTLLNLDSAQRIGIIPIPSAAGGAPEAADFAFDFDPQPPPVAAADPSPDPGASTAGALAPMQAQITASLQTWLSQANIPIETEALEALVASAFATASTGPALGAPLEPELAPPAAPPSAGKRRAEEAIQAVEQSFQNAEESIEQARKRTKPVPVLAESATPPVEQPEPEFDAAERFVTEQQLHILNLLKEGHISVSQADMLLKALTS